MSESTPAEDAPQPAPPTDPATETPQGHSHEHPPEHHLPGAFFCFRNIFWVTFFLLLSAATRCANYKGVFLTSPDGHQRIFFADGDCYARMTRVRAILEHGGLIHYHLFENYPKGVWPHTTAPMDYFIVLIALLLKPFCHNFLDMAGAICSPILGVMTTGFLALWARQLNQQYRRVMLLLASLSPILVQGTCLGRPDHQSMQIFLLAVGIGAELIMARAPKVSWGIVSGLAWGLALWVSLYEPLVMILVIYVTKVIFYRPNLFVKERIPGIGVLLAILGLAWLLEGQYLLKSFSIAAHDQAIHDYAAQLDQHDRRVDQCRQHGDEHLLRAALPLGRIWPAGLAAAADRPAARYETHGAAAGDAGDKHLSSRSRRRAGGYFFALVFAMSLPWQLSLFRTKWLVWLLYLASLWPVASQWDYWLFDQKFLAAREVRLQEQGKLRDAAHVIGDHAPGGILAPWWWSPQLAYWSGQPAVAGSSHESLSGIVDTAKFFSTTDPKVAQAVCDARNVETVVIGNPASILAQSVHILGQPNPTGENTMADILYLHPSSAPIFLHLLDDEFTVKVFEVNHGSLIKK